MTHSNNRDKLISYYSFDGFCIQYNILLRSQVLGGSKILLRKIRSKKISKKIEKKNRPELRDIKNGHLVVPSAKASFNVANNREMTNNLRKIFKMFRQKFDSEFAGHARPSSLPSHLRVTNVQILACVRRTTGGIKNKTFCL